MKCYNAFGIKPTNTYTSAGTDYYIPNLDTPEKVERAYKAFEKSYGKTSEYIGDIAQKFNIVLVDRNTNIPGVLIECGFLSNSNDRYLLQTKFYQKKFSKAITNGVIEYLNT